MIRPASKRLARRIRRDLSVNQSIDHAAKYGPQKPKAAEVVCECGNDTYTLGRCDLCSRDKPRGKA